LTDTGIWAALAFGAGLFVAFESSGTVTSTSPDGINWTTGALASGASWNYATFANGQFVALGTDAGGVLNTSVDGLTWRTRALVSNTGWAGVCFSNGLFVFVGSTSTVSCTAYLEGATSAYLYLSGTSGKFVRVQ
jgi:hypothetical protein